MTEAVKTPWHIWAVGVVSLLWNGFGAFDYTMTKTHNMAYLKDFNQFTPEQIAYFDGISLLGNIGWAFGVWGALAGSVLLLCRSRHAVSAFMASLAGLLVSTFNQFILSDVDLGKLFGPGPMVTTIVIWIIAIALFLYARKQAAAGVLR
jgi:hypothetical protein